MSGVTDADESGGWGFLLVARTHIPAARAVASLTILVRGQLLLLWWWSSVFLRVGVSSAALVSPSIQLSPPYIFTGGS